MKKAVLTFSGDEREAFYRVIYARRDIRHFKAGATVNEQVLSRILSAAHSAPSVGLMQPWRFIRVQERSLRMRIAALVEKERQQTALALQDECEGEKRAEEFLKLKVEGIKECAELIAVVLAPDDGTVFGRRTMPNEMALCSVACAIQNLWLAARAENLGVGWVSMFDPDALAEMLHCSATAKPVALLCVGPADVYYEKPMLEQCGWRQGRAVEEILYSDYYGNRQEIVGVKSS